MNIIKINENKLRQSIRKHLKKCLQSTNNQIVQISENKITKMISDVTKSVLTEAFNRLPGQDAEYMEAVENGDMEKAGAMLRAAFKAKFPNTKVVDENGEPLVVYHGTNVNINVFDKDKTNDTLFWFSSNKSAIEKGEVGASNSGIIKSIYLNLTNPAGWDEYDKYYIDQLIDDGYDGLKLDDTYVAFEPNQIKSAEAVTYDDEGNVIPLSERFNENRNDIRF